jgi:magnesium-transporting ATPase (P-type)
MAKIPDAAQWHSMPFDKALEALTTSPEGLSSKEASLRLKKFGPNKIHKRNAESAFSIFFKQFINPLIYVLLAATILAIVMGKFTDASVIFSVIIINSIIGFMQEYQAGNAIRKLLNLVPEISTVLRDGDQKNIPSAELVTGDYILLQAGDSISADIRLTFTKNFTCNESILTGESWPAEKTTEVVNGNVSIADRKCMAFSGTFVTSGTAEGVVVGTAGKTEVGKIAALLQATGSPKSPLTKTLEKIGRTITLVIIIVSVVVFVIGLLRDYPIAESILSAITLAVAAIPEGLPAVITISSAIGIVRMAKRKAIIRHLSSVETLGSTTVICSDKTGTLTRNEMTVQMLWNGRQKFRVTGTGINPDGKVLKETDNSNASEDELGELIRASVLCNDATLFRIDEGQWKAVGDPTEVALVTLGRKFGIVEDLIRDEWKRLDELPFDPARKIMATLHQSPINGEKVVYIKGAPESLMALFNKSGVINHEDINVNASAMASVGMRLLAFASKRLPKEDKTLSITEELLRDFEFLGLTAMKDPPREEVKLAINQCYQAGITIKMITGDHPETATAIARELALKDADKVITGQQLQKMVGNELLAAAKGTNIFARVSPEDKLRLVEALQGNGEVVAMTGDGVNDAPALKRADIGVAMGISGTAVAREASDMILVNDNFESIVAAVEEGRRVFDNLLKCVVFLLPTSIGLGLVIFISVLFFPALGGELIRPMLPVQVLWINLITAITLTLPLAFEALEPDVMKRPPTRQDKPLLSSVVIFRMIIVSLIMASGTIGLFLWEYHVELSKGMAQSIAITEAQTMAVTTMVLFQIFYLLTCRSLKFSVLEIGIFSNPLIYIGIVIIVILQLLFVYAPFMQNWFHSSSLTAEAWGISALIAFTIIIIVGFEKWIRKKNYFRYPPKIKTGKIL